MAIVEPTDWPIPGYTYSLQPRDPETGRYDSMSHIASKAYGSGTRKYWRPIWKANKHKAKKRRVVDEVTGDVSYVLDPNYGFDPGDVITIPGDRVAEEVKEDLREEAEEFLGDVGPNDITIIVKGERVPVESARVLTTFDTAAEGWAATLPLNPENEKQRELLRPYAYHPAEAYVGGELMVRGTLYTVSPRVRPTESTITAEGWSLTADIIDSVTKAPLEQKSVTLQERAAELIDGLGIGLEFEIDDDPKFDRATADKTETILSHLGELAQQRGVQISSTNQGRLLFHRAASGPPVATIIEGFPPFEEVTAKYDGRTRFNSYTAFSQTPKKKSKSAVSNDDAVPGQRFTAFSADDVPEGELQKAADWRRSKQLGQSMELSLPVNSFYNPETGEKWRVNTLVTVVSDSLFLPNGFDFLIRQVEYVVEDKKSRAILGLVPPQVYTGEPLDDIFADQGAA